MKKILFILIVLFFISMTSVSAENYTDCDFNQIDVDSVYETPVKEYVTFNYHENMSEVEREEMLNAEERWLEENNYFMDKQIDTPTILIDRNNLYSEYSSEELILQNMDYNLNDICGLRIYDNRVLSGTNLKLYFIDSQGERLAMENLRLWFIINNICYNRTTNAYGIAAMAINLNPGDCPIVMGIWNTGLSAEFTITVYRNHVNLTYYGQTLHVGDRFYMKLTDDGVPISGSVIHLNINGVQYTRTTDQNGQCNIQINLNPYFGPYDITLYSEYRTSYFQSPVIGVTLTVYSANSNLIPTTISVVNQVCLNDNLKEIGVKLVNSNNGAAIVGEDVGICINGMLRYTDTGNDGIAYFDMSGWNPGFYSLVVNYGGSSTYKTSWNYSLIYVADSSLSSISNMDSNTLNTCSYVYNGYCDYTNDYISSLYSSITATCSNDLEKTLACFNYAKGIIHISYDGGGVRYGALGTILNNLGNCVDHSNVLVSLIRSAHIPILYVLADCLIPGQDGHAWTQICLDGIWLCVDSDATTNFGTFNNMNYYYNFQYLTLIP